MTLRYGLFRPLRASRSDVSRRARWSRAAIWPTMATLIFLPWTGPAAAQEAPPDTAQRQDSMAIPLDPVVVTVSKLPLRPSASGFAVTVVPEVRLRTERPRYAMDALRELPGAFIDEATGPGGPSIVRLRGGEEVFTQILMDGVQVNENGGFFDFQGVTLTNIGRVEVARGPQSALYGSSAVSGVVQFLTPRGEAGPVRLGGTLEGGADIGHGRSFRGSAMARGGTDAVTYSAGAGLAYNRGIYELPHDTWTRDASLRLDAAPGDRLSVTGIARFIGVQSQHPVRDAGVTRVPLDPNARLGRDRYVVTGRARFQATPRWTHGLNVSAFRHDFEYIDERDDIAQPPDFFVLDADLTATSDVRRTTVEYVGSYTTTADPLDAPVALAYGALWEREELHTTLTGDFGDNEADFDRESVAGFADLRAGLHPRLDLLVGARAERFEGLGTEITPRGSLTFRVVPGLLSLRAAAGRAYKVPNLRQQFQDDPFIAPNPDLEAETSVSWETGADLEMGRLGLSATGFHQTYYDLIRTVPHETEPRLQDRNVGESRAWGVEAGLRYRFDDGLSAGLDATRTWTEIVDNTGLPPDQYPEGGSLPFRPDVTASAYVLGTPMTDIEVVGRATYIGGQTVLTERFSGQRADLDGYVRVDGTVSYLMGADRRVYVRVRNLLNTAYETAFDRPGIPLSLALGVAVNP